MLSILIATLPQRESLFLRLIEDLRRQSDHRPVEVLVEDSVELSIGEKRNQLMGAASGDYLCFIDDDDRICENYIDLLLEAMEAEPDCCSLNGIITFDGEDPKLFKHSIDYLGIYEEEGVYYRPPNHLNCIRTEIARRFKFPGLNFGEDADFCMQMLNAGALQVEYKIEPVLYYYDYVSSK